MSGFKATLYGDSATQTLIGLDDTRLWRVVCRAPLGARTWQCPRGVTYPPVPPTNSDVSGQPHVGQSMAGLWLVVTTVNAATGVPLIEHKFFGRTQAEAQQRYETHMQADAFIRSCGAYDGRPHDYNGTPCMSTWRWEQA